MSTGSCNWVRQLGRGTARPGSGGVAKQGGQALIEGLVAMLGLLVLWGAIGWLARWQDIALQSAHASRALAFERVRNPHAEQESTVLRNVFHQASQVWNDRRGGSLVSGADGTVRATVRREGVLPQDAQPGQAGALAEDLRNELKVADSGMVTARVMVVPAMGHDDAAQALHVSLKPGPRSGRSSFLPGLALERHTSLLVDAGHSESHARTQLRISDSGTAWKTSSAASTALGRRVESVMDAVDAPWKRAAPDFDWLMPWSDRMPAHIHHDDPGSRQ